jgi:hypothetical protein
LSGVGDSSGIHRSDVHSETNWCSCGGYTLNHGDSLSVVCSGECGVGRIVYINRCDTHGDTGERVVAVGISDCGVSNTESINQSNHKSTHVRFTIVV